MQIDRETEVGGWGGKGAERQIGRETGRWGDRGSERCGGLHASGTGALA